MSSFHEAVAAAREEVANRPKKDPCPFCRTDVELKMDLDDKHGQAVWDIGCYNEDCLAAPTMEGFSHPEDAVQAWNWQAHLIIFVAHPAIQTAVDKQALDEGLWFEAVTAPEAYLQQELRALHGVIENVSRGT